MRDAPFFFLVRLYATADSVDFIASEEVHYEAGKTPDATQAAEEAGAFFTAEPHHVDEDEIESAVVKVWGPFYLDPLSVLETSLVADDESETGWNAA